MRPEQWQERQFKLPHEAPKPQRKGFRPGKEHKGPPIRFDMNEFVVRRATRIEQFFEAYFTPRPTLPPPLPMPVPKKPTLRELREFVAEQSAIKPLSFLRDFKNMFGLTLLGEGSFSSVYALDEKRALKIVRATDPGYRRFVDKCLANKGHPYLPKIYWRGQWGSRDVYIMERLQPPHRNNLKRYALIEALRIDTGNNPYLKIEVTCPHLRSLREILKDQMNDLHGGNVLSRADGTPVVTDTMPS